MYRNFYFFIFTFFLFACSKEIIQQKLTVDVTPANGGTVSPPTNSFEKGSVVSLFATPAGEYIFKQWQGGVSGTNNPTSITLDTDKQVTGVFEKRQYPLTLTIEGNGTVKEEVIAVASQAQYPSGTTVKLTATPNQNYSFNSWSGDLSDKNNPIQLTISKPITVIANFIQNNFSPVVLPNSKVNKTTNQFLDNYYFPGFYYTLEKAFQTRLNINQRSLLDADFRFNDATKCFLDFNKDGKLDLFAFAINFKDAPFASKPGKYILVDNVLDEKKAKYSSFETSSRFSRNISLIDIENDGEIEVLMDNYDDHSLLDGSNGAAGKSKIIKISKDGNIKETGFTEYVSNHGQTSGDIDNDGDVDVLIWRNGNLAGALNQMPSLYLNDGVGNMTQVTDFKYFKGLDVILKNNEGKLRNFNMSSVELFDLDGDGNLDIISGGFHTPHSDNPLHIYTQNTRVYWGLGNGYFDFINNFTDLPNTYNLNNRLNVNTDITVLGINFFDYNNDGNVDIISSLTPDYGGHIIQIHKNLGGRKFEDNTVDLVDKYSSIFPRNTQPLNVFPDFYKLRPFDVDKDGDFDLVPDQVAIWSIWDYPIAQNLYWENLGGKFIRKGF